MVQGLRARLLVARSSPIFSGSAPRSGPASAADGVWNFCGTVLRALRPGVGTALAIVQSSDLNAAMLAELRVSNLVVVEQAQLEFCSSLNVFTGETGAGKSLLVDALALLFGGRADGNLVRPGADRSEVTARFVLSDAELVEALQESLGIVFEAASGSAAPAERRESGWELVVNRIIPRQGRARAYANGRPIAQTTLKDLGDHLIDLHGQHENQSLLRASTRLEILDRFAEAQAEREACRAAWQAARAAAERLAELRQAARDRSGREEFVRFQLRELEQARLDEGGIETLENELKMLRGAESIRAATEGAAERLDGEEGSAAQALARALRDLEGLKDPPPEAAALTGRLQGLLAETQDLARDLATLAEKARSDPERLAELDDRRAALRSLERKHGRDVNGLVALRAELREKLSDLTGLEVRTDEAEQGLERALKALSGAAAALTRKRRGAARELEKDVNAELKELDLKGAVLKVELVPHDARPDPAPASAEGTQETEAARLLPAQLRASGAEQLELLFSANPELPPKPLNECASGGELSRVMLALKSVLARAGGADRLPVVVFDEIDSGVGGRLGAVLGRKLSGLARVRQVLCVTHLPQLAAYASRQIKVEKHRKGETTAVTVAPVEGEARIEELSLMLRGESASKHTREEAAEMLRAAQDERTSTGRARRRP